MKKLILFTALITAFAISASAQECPVGLTCFTQADADRISTGLAELKASRTLIVALEEQVKLKDQVIQLKDDLLQQKNMTLAAKEETIIRLTAMKCSRGSVIFFLIKWKRCS